MLNLSAHVDFSLGIPSLLRATLEMASERALEALNAVDDFVKPESFVLLVHAFRVHGGRRLLP